jgi:hypothetical protein
MASIIAIRSAQSDAEGVVMPVRPAQAIYANFRHIQVLPDTRLQDGVPLYKLRILDSLIERMAAPGPQRNGGILHAAAMGGTAPRDEGGVDRLIGDITRGLRASGQSPGTSSYRAGFLPLPGAFVDLVA